MSVGVFLVVNADGRRWEGVMAYNVLARSASYRGGIVGEQWWRRHRRKRTRCRRGRRDVAWRRGNDLHTLPPPHYTLTACVVSAMTNGSAVFNDGVWK